jgi:histone H3/H4
MDINDINVPLSMCKKILGLGGMRVQPESINKFEEKFRAWAKNISDSVTQKCADAKRKTIMPEDLD